MKHAMARHLVVVFAQSAFVWIQPQFLMKHIIVDYGIDNSESAFLIDL